MLPRLLPHSTALSGHLRGNRLKVRRDFVGIVELFYQYGIPLVYVPGMHKPVLVRIHFLLLLARCVAF